MNDADRTVCSLLEDRHVEVQQLTTVIAAISFRFSGEFGEWVADLMRRRGAKQPPLSISVGGRPALAYDWTDGVADVYSAFVALDTATGVEFEFTSCPRAAFPSAVLDSVDWLDRRPSQRALDSALEAARTLRIWDGNPDKKRRRRKPDSYKTEDAAEVRAFVRLLRVRTDTFVDIPGGWGPSFEFRDEHGSVIARMAIVEGPQLSWPDRWDADPFFVDFEPIRRWLEERGVPVLV